MSIDTNNKKRRRSFLQIVNAGARRIPLLNRVPSYAGILLICMVLLNTAVYNGTRIFTTGARHYNLSGPVDAVLPFLPVFSAPYVMAFVQWVVGYILIAGEGKKYCYRVFTAEMLAKIAAGITFIILPTTICRPQIQVNDLFTAITSFIYQADAADNLFPSIHCLESYFCFRCMIPMKTVPGYVKVCMGIMTFLVFLSTVFIRQHVILDMLGAVLYAELALFISCCLFRRKTL